LASISAGQYKVNNWSWTSSATTVYSGDKIVLSGTTSSNYSTTVNVVLTVWGVSDTFAITTKASWSSSSSSGWGSVGWWGSYYSHSYPTKTSHNDEDEDNDNNNDSDDDSSNLDDQEFEEAVDSVEKKPIEIIISW